jgi:membrane-associated protein
MLGFDQGTIAALGLAGIAAIVFAETGLLIGFVLPGDSLLFTAGFLAAQGAFDSTLPRVDGHPILSGIVLLSIICAVAAVLGDSCGYLIGRAVGPRLFTREDSVWFHRKHLERAHAFYERQGGKAIVLAQFMPIVRTFSPVVAGIARMDYVRFATFNVVAALAWGMGIPWLGYFLGQVPIVHDNLEKAIVLIILASLAPSAIHIWREEGNTIMARLRSRAAS